ncbi:MAG TPA: uroporphyrinogen-III C-methyltransferase [Candidatus Manganitrophaceae bacterium]|nr:uroporphyrinogen-III C-methyltransferase [Candidatus Manganitrophaceae bacterium]
MKGNKIDRITDRDIPNSMQNQPSNQNIGKVYLVGAGPGDPKLLTLRGKELLEQADTIIYDYLANPMLLAFAREGAETVYVGKKGGSRNTPHQEKINLLMIEAARAGKRVIRLKGGDPFVFGRGGEETEALVAAGIPFEVVPGVTSAIGVPAYAGIPLTHRHISSTVTFITGHEHPKEESRVYWEKLAKGADTLVFLMGMGNLSEIVENLIRYGRDPKTPVGLVRWGTYPFQKTLIGRLDDIVEKVASSGMKPPVVIIVGEVISLREKLNWFESRPLFGKRIVVTRAKEQAPAFTELLASYGAEVLSFPTLQIVPPPSWAPLDAAIEKIESYHWLIFTSVNGVHFFKKRLSALGKDLRLLKGISLCAIGPRTAEEVEAWGLRVDLVPPEFVAEGILEALEKKGIAGRRFLIPRALEAREILPEEIKNRGGEVEVVPAYQAVRPEYDPKEIDRLFGKEPVDMITFASASTLRNFAEIVGRKNLKERLGKSAVACIGPITAEAAKKFGLMVNVIPKEYTFPALAEAIVDYFTKKG